MANILAKMAVQISANTAEFNKALQKTNKEINTFTGQIKGIAGTLGVAFGVQQIAAFTFEAAKLAGVFEGVKAAFDKLENSERLLEDLQRATAGTVSELNLMKRAVQFSNFGLELSKLPSLLEFATKRAQATGQSVDYLVDSIVTGLGRKSVLILDNLGISAIQLREEMAKVGDITVAVSNIIERDVANSGNVMDTAAMKAERYSVAVENLKISFGNLANSSGFQTGVKILTDFIDIISGQQSGNNGAIYLPWGKVIQLSDDAKKNLTANLGEIQKSFREAAKAGFNYVKPIETIASLSAELKVLEEQRLGLTGQQLSATNREIESINKKIKALRELGIEQAKKPLGGLQFIVPELSGDNANTKAANDAAEFATQLAAIGTSADFAGGALIQLEESTGAVKEALKETFDISGLVAGGITDIANAFGEAATGSVNFGDAIIRSLASFAQQFGAILIATGIGKIAFNKFNGPAMIAAGAALVALGGAVRGIISNRPSLGGGGPGRGGSGFNVSAAGALNFANGYRNSTIALEARGTSMVAVINESDRRTGRLQSNMRRI